MTYYPFDVQDCTAEIEVAKADQIVSLVKNRLENPKKNLLCKFKVIFH